MRARVCRLSMSLSKAEASLPRIRRASQLLLPRAPRIKAVTWTQHPITRTPTPPRTRHAARSRPSGARAMMSARAALVASQRWQNLLPTAPSALHDLLLVLDVSSCTYSLLRTSSTSSSVPYSRLPPSPRVPVLRTFYPPPALPHSCCSLLRPHPPSPVTFTLRHASAFQHPSVCAFIVWMRSGLQASRASRASHVLRALRARRGQGRCAWQPSLEACQSRVARRAIAAGDRDCDAAPARGWAAGFTP
jgi:hypothetical protein